MHENSKKSKIWKAWFKFSKILLGLLLWGTAPPCGGDPSPTRVVTTKYGPIQGIIRHHTAPSLGAVDTFLGVPYASPPTGEGRFTPTSSPLPWDEVKKCTQLPPVCPQPFPDAGYPAGSVPPERRRYLRTLRPHLERQSEDCLYLNIYAPHDGGGRHPVMVFIQGEDFWWGSGNLYDGGVLASYGGVVVVTLNYRLGPLGFLNTSPTGASPKVVGNQGLMDQLAALSWVHENVGEFGGDPQRVTLFGHAAGAACISYLMVSPVLVPGLFQRAILMSGSALSPWAEVPHGISATAQLAQALNCSLPPHLGQPHPETISCLRGLAPHALVSAPLPRYKFGAIFGPSVDGVVIPADFRARVARDASNVSVVVGVTQGDAFPHLTRRQALEGLTLQERNRLFRTFVRSSYDRHLQEVFLAMCGEYTDWGSPSHHPLEVQAHTVEALSDAAYVAPAVRTAELLSATRATFLYVYTHAPGPHQISKFATELDLVFGVPYSSSPSPQSPRSPRMPPTLGDGGGDYGGELGETSRNFTRDDALVSEILMKLWSNFAKFGTPTPQEGAWRPLGHPDRPRLRNLTWDSYDSVHQRYLDISTRPRVRDHYRAHKVALWNWLLPQLLQGPPAPPGPGASLWYGGASPDFFVGPVRPLDPFRFMHTTQSPFTSPAPLARVPKNEFLGPNVSAAHGVSSMKGNLTEDDPDLDRNPLLDYTTALTLTVAIGLSLLVLNFILFAALLYRRDRSQMSTKINYDSVSVQPLCTVDSGMRSGGPSMTQEGMTPPGKEGLAPCKADIQVTELRTFPTPPDIGDRNTEVSSYSSASPTFTSTTGAAYTSTTGAAYTSGKRRNCGNVETSQFVPPPPILTSSTSAHQAVDFEVPSNLGSPVMMGPSGPSCTSGGTCPIPQQGSSFPPTSASYCPPPPYCNEFPITQYSSGPFTSCQQFTNTSTNINKSSNSQQRTASLNRNANNAVCALANRKPRPSPRVSPTSAGLGTNSSTFASLPRQSSSDSSSHIIA